MEDRKKEETREGTESGRLQRAVGPIFLLALLVFVWIVTRRPQPQGQEISHDFFVTQLEEENIAEVVSVSEFEKTGTFKKAPQAPPIFKDGKWVTPIGEDEKPLVLSEEFTVRLDPLISQRERERIDALEIQGGVRRWSKRDSTKLLSVLVPLLPVLAILLFVIWIWLLIDCLRNEPSEGNDKIVWVLVIVLLNGLGALIYLIVRRPERMRRFGR
jgi:hypothetical protein